MSWIFTVSTPWIEKEFFTEKAAKAWLTKNGWKKAASRVVYVHRVRQHFYMKNEKSYDNGVYAFYETPIS